MIRIATITLAVTALAVPLFAQQLEVNTPGGSLTSGLFDPTPGSPFIVNPAADNTMNMEVGGVPFAAYAFIVGDLATTSQNIGDGQFFDLDQGSAVLVGNGFQTGGGSFPPIVFYLGASGQSLQSVPVNPAMLGLSFAFQAIVFDATQLFQLNMTAAAEFSIRALTIITGDDNLVNVNLLNPIPMYGQTFSEVAVDTNGWLQLGPTTATSDFSEDPDDFVAGSPGSAPPGSGPVLAVLWEDLDFGNDGSQSVTVEEISPMVTVIAYNNGDYFPATAFGSIRCTLDRTLGRLMIRHDYTGYTNASPPQEGLVGISDGGTTAGNMATTHDLVVGGIVNPFSPTTPSVTVFQDFSGAGTTVPPLPAEPLDVAQLPELRVFDSVGSGAFFLF